MGVKQVMVRMALAVLAAGPCAQALADVPVPGVDTFTVHSTVPAEDRHMVVYTPPGYATSGLSYPVLYMPDGGLQEDFPHVAEMADKLIRAGEMAPVLIVGIENTERRRDMTGPTTVASDKAIAPRVGGSANFRAFIAGQLIPHVESHYRTTKQRGLIGESLAGLFVVETLVRQPSLFDVYIAISPSLWWNNAALAAGPLDKLKTKQAAVRLVYLTSADEDTIAPHVATFARALKQAKLPGLRLVYEPRPAEHHDTIYRASEESALKAAYPVGH
ncbi:hypothetical protein FHW69_001852 [Luteibacter sp. Sphag1AF]|uniref:alpha/beta hydrolase n=1 Tax=Luteibacter sp. Sphag1AF TaxID=2587031 RepID=UPI0017A27239|nr:alpha/beta hydrolase-fold protein [Luteibacter sp. Sphag1AF]MBB3227251.1 hypothetical protein [Luteibacter sp. Sphag1AF]